MYLAEVSFGTRDLGPVMIPVSSQKLSDSERAQMVADAREFHTKGLFIQSCTNPRFLKDLAGGFHDDLGPLQLQQYVAASLAQQALDHYFHQLQQKLGSDAANILKRTKSFLSVSRTETLSSGIENEYSVTLPNDYPTKLVDEFGNWTAPFFEKPRGNRKANFWAMFAKWAWTNQMAHAMCDLEKQIGVRRLERMKPERLFAEVLRVYGEDATAGPELARLTAWYLGEFANILFEAFGKLTMEQLELVLLLRRKERDRLVVLDDVGAAADRVLRRPKDMYSIASRDFEKLIAFALSQSGYDHVRLTPPTRDGGYDIEAIRNGPISQRLLVECKRYAQDRKVGRPTLDGLLGVLQREKANQALLATTSSFSKDAIELLKLEPWRLQGMDIENILELLRRTRRN